MLALLRHRRPPRQRRALAVGLAVLLAAAPAAAPEGQQVDSALPALRGCWFGHHPLLLLVLVGWRLRRLAQRQRRLVAAVTQQCRSRGPSPRLQCCCQQQQVVLMAVMAAAVAAAATPHPQAAARVMHSTHPCNALPAATARSRRLRHAWPQQQQQQMRMLLVQLLSQAALRS